MNLQALAIAGLLAFTAHAVQAQTLACNPEAPRTDPGSGFTVTGAAEQLLARGGNSGPGWEWALDDTKGSLDWISGRVYQWTLTYTRVGAATVEIRDQGALLLSLTKASGMNPGNALRLQLATNPSIGADTTISAAATTINGQPVSGAISQAGNRQDSSKELFFYFPAMSQGFSATGNVTLSFNSLPTGSRVNFQLHSGNVPCNNVTPSVAITAPAADSLHQAGNPIRISAIAADTDGTVAQVEFFANGSRIGTGTAAPFSFDWTNAPAGTHNLTARAIDNAGDRTTSTAVSLTVNAQPTVSITSPASGTVVQASGTITLEAGGTDSDGTIDKVNFYQGGALIGTDAKSPYSLALSNLAVGTYTFTAVASDNRGGVATSAPVSLRVNAPPSVSVTSPTNDAVFTAPANIPFSVDSSDADGTIAAVDYYFGTTLITTQATAPFSFTWNGVPQGSYVITAKARDNDGAIVTSRVVNITVKSGVPKLHFIHVDHLNTPRFVANDQGQTVWRWDQQEPFGVNVPDENPGRLGTFDLPLRLPGQYFDKETNLYYNHFRDYDPNLGRYVESDPIGIAWSLNLYNYVGGNPTQYADPLGLFRMYGNWGGRNWSGGMSSPTVPVMDTRPTTPGGPVDQLDLCFMDHDRCYGAVETGCLSPSDVHKSIADCDRRLITCIDRLPNDPSLWCAYNPLHCNTARRSARWWFSR